jgi:hypothetical protein
MNQDVLLQNYFSTASNINISLFFMDMLLATGLSLLLSFLYTKFGVSISNRKSFASNFVLLTLTTFLVISIIKSSLALSLGLVGALSIVRFRAAIKEPEELVYLFLCISVGLGFGAEQRYITLLAFSLIFVILIIHGLFKKPRLDYTNLFVKIPTSNSETIDQILTLLKKFSQVSTLKRLDQTVAGAELLIGSQFKNTKDLLIFKDKALELNKGMEISFYEDKGIIN